MNPDAKIMLVDDEFHIRVYLKYIIKQLGYPKIVEARDGEEAVMLYGRERPDVVLLDVNLPRMDGIETLKTLKEIDPKCTVVMLTSLANRRTIDAALANGALNYIRKDTPKEEIAAVLGSILKQFDIAA